MVTKEFCKDVPEKEDVMADVETCVNTPKQVKLEKVNQFNILLFQYRFARKEC
jgi:hypothetical protein